MIGLSEKLFFAVEAVLYIAYNASCGTISSRDIAARQGLPPRYLESLMQRLVKAGILRGIRGPKGGYVLARERRKICVADICEALEETHEQKTSTPLGTQVVRPVWNHAEQQMMLHLKQITLADLCEQAAKKKIKKMSEEKMDFAI